jgi:hypothetical protein
MSVVWKTTTVVRATTTVVRDTTTVVRDTTTVVRMTTTIVRTTTTAASTATAAYLHVRTDAEHRWPNLSRPEWSDQKDQTSLSRKNELSKLFLWLNITLQIASHFDSLFRF